VGELLTPDLAVRLGRAAALEAQAERIAAFLAVRGVRVTRDPASARHARVVVLRRDPLADLQLDREDYAWISAQLLALARAHADGRLVSTLEGGYDLPALADSVCAHVSALME